MIDREKGDAKYDLSHDMVSCVVETSIGENEVETTSGARSGNASLVLYDD